MFVLNFYSPVFVDQLRRHRKTATIRLGDKSAKYRKGNVVMVTVVRFSQISDRPQALTDRMQPGPHMN